MKHNGDNVVTVVSDQAIASVLDVLTWNGATPARQAWRGLERILQAKTTRLIGIMASSYK